MARRVRAHQLEDLSRTSLSRTFQEVGWVVHNLVPDYGEDLLVRVFRDGLPTSLAFYVQAKATDNIGHHADRKDSSKYVVRVQREHLEHWESVFEPVVITLWDSQSDTTYWEIITRTKDVAGEVELRSTKTWKTVPIIISAENTLDPKGVQRLLAKVTRHFDRFFMDRQVVDLLVDFLKNDLKLDVDYDRKSESLSIMEPKGGLWFFGESAREIRELEAMSGKTAKQLLIDGVRRDQERKQQIQEVFDRLFPNLIEEMEQELPKELGVHQVMNQDQIKRRILEQVWKRSGITNWKFLDSESG